MESSDDYVMLSALQHFVYCPRQFALIHLEQVWQENIYTLRGLRVHERVDTPSHELIEGVRVERSLSLISHHHHLRGIADVVEFLADGTPYPVEYKSGARKAKQADAVQLCAQALCLEEIHHLGGIVAFGNVLISPFLIHRCAADGRSIVWLSQSGRFQARLTGPTTGNVLLRRSQHGAIADPVATLEIARYVVAGKLQNARAVLMRAAREAKESTDQTRLRAAAQIHAEGIQSAEKATEIDQLRGIEGYAAKAYFGAFGAMIRTNRDFFEFKERSKRPPKDGINALLSFAYTLLANECVAACEGVGLDPQMGFSHVLRPGRPSLALDLMEELRPIIADRLVLNLVNRGQIKPGDFVERPGGGVYLTEDARKDFLVAYQKRKQEEVMHSIVESKVPLGLLCHLQARLLARHLRGDIPQYPPFILRG